MVKTGGISTSGNGHCGPCCPVCKGTGYFRYEVGLHDPRFGKIYPCPQWLQTQLLNHGGGGLTPEEVRELKWSMVRVGISAGHRARQAAEAIFETGWGLLFLYGRFGQGKTLVLKVGVAQALRAGLSAWYANISQILEDIRGAFDGAAKYQELSRRMAKWIGLDVLAIDELDKVNATPWAREKIHHLLDQRYTRAVREQAITMVAANLDGDFNSLDGYLASRLKDNRVGKLIQLDGPDGREVMPVGWRF